MNNQRERLSNKLEGEDRYFRASSDLCMYTRAHMGPLPQTNTFMHTDTKEWIERRNKRGERNERREDDGQAEDNTGRPGES